MVAYIFQNIAKEGLKAGIKPGTKASRDWFRDRASAVTRVNTKQLVDSADKKRVFTTLSKQDVGRMYTFFYNPKHKKTLPYYDRFPLIFVIDLYADGFLGMNMHYIPLLFRARLMDALYSIQINDTARADKKLALTYNLLARASKFRYFKPTIKRYLFQKVTSRYIYIPTEEWDIAAFVPSARFVKATERTVHNESRNSLRV
jgi:hypothetical protein